MKLTGKQIVMEDLRQYCLYKKLSLKNIQEMFFQYIQDTYDFCPGRIDEQCHLRALKKLEKDSGNKFKGEWVQQCVKESFESMGAPNYAKDDNRFLREMSQQW